MHIKLCKVCGDVVVVVFAGWGIRIARGLNQTACPREDNVIGPVCKRAEIAITAL